MAEAKKKADKERTGSEVTTGEVSPAGTVGVKVAAAGATGARSLVLAGLFASLTAVGAWITIPLPLVPVTLQVFFVLLAGVLLGGRLGAASQVIYILLGLAGAPVFAGGAGGLGTVLRPTFGYLAGYIPAAYLSGRIAERAAPGRRLGTWTAFLATLAGLGVVYLFGASYLYFALNYLLGKPMGVKGVLMAGVAPFLPVDIAKSVVVALVAPRVRNGLQL
ncbi:MAG: biotin transporter BioY [Firmicutes bacterium]|nr:biotin transporter BioY [Bacillota bacterium]